MRTPPQMSPRIPFSTLARAVADGAQPAELLLEMHRDVLAALGGSASVLLERLVPSGPYVATSGRGFTDLGGAWLEAADAERLDRLAATGPALATLDGLAPLQHRLGSSQALVVRIAGPGAPGFLVVAAPAAPAPEALALADRLGLEFGLALELARLGRDAAFHRRIQEVLLVFSRGVSGTLSLDGALRSLAQDVNTLFATARTSVWLHDRRAHKLMRHAVSDGDEEARTIATDSPEPAARGMRLDRAEFIEAGGGRVLIAPLRGWRRALGTLVVEGLPPDADEAHLREAAYEIGRQLSVAIENVHLLAEVMQQRRLLEDIFNSLTDLVVVVDNQLRVVQMNHAFATRASSRAPAELNQSLEALVGPEIAGWVAEEEAAAQEPGGAARSRQFEDDRLGGTFTVTVTPLINQDGDPVGRVAVARDITRQMRLEAEREGLRQQLAQSERLASLGQFVAGIAHEINNPLQGVLGHVELLIDGAEVARPVRATLRQIYQEGDRAAKIVRDLLVFTGSRQMGREKVRVDRIVARSLASRRAARARAHVEVTREIDAEAPQVLGDPLRLQQAFVNVLVNAEHATAEQDGPRRIAVSVGRSAEGMVRVAIRDNGPGIAAEVLPRIFDPFFTTKDVGRGTGLGLTITYGIIQEHHGTISAANAPGGGAQFTIDLPAAE